MNSIERTLLWRLFAGALVLLAVGAGLLYAGSGWLLTRQFDTTLRTKLATFIALTEEEGYDIELGFDEKSMPEFGAVTKPEYFELCLAEGESLYRSPSLGSAGLPFRHGPEEAPEIWDLTLPDGRAGRAIGAEFVVHHYEAAAEDPGPARVVLVLARGRDELDRSLALLSGGTVTGILLLLCGGYVIGRSAVRRGLHPLEALVRHVRGVEDPLRAPRFPSQGVPSELAPLVDSHNQMLERLARAFEGERRTSANIAHELRTPVAELLLLTETAERWSEQEGELGHRLGELRELGTQMSTLIATILELARMESGRVALEMEPLDLAEAVQACWVPLAAKAAVKRLELSTQFVDGPPARADRAALSILLTNVLANAVEHAPEGDVLVCALTRGPERVLLSLSNAAPALAAEDLENLTEPFWRKDSARADRTHAGLGLALVARLSALLDARLAFALEQGRFRVELGFTIWNASAEAPLERNGVAHHRDGAALESG